MLVFAGLGNPGPKFAGQRHNIGFMVADEIIRRYGLSTRKSRHHAYIAEGNIVGQKVLLLKPKTFMNESGRALGSALRYLKLRPGAVTVFYDELDLVPGKVRVKMGGGHAGHNGIRSISSHIGQDYRRIRIGVGHPGNKQNVHRYVLSDFSKAEKAWVDRTIEAIAEALPIAVNGDDAGFMTRVAYLAPPPSKDEKA
ncbi:MAG: Peptidyl-tRNA hydrolase [Alphaproteobacteria bacterium MarineAlpha11_Bin1]|nr:MAG: Peptidyl-tRNA hydrolase [Alphaproteobacteria bacterium MarineAlpha11_Bin1]|tara:strand:- start:716 stop:1306 length:591 start_codon:yes stop_codon:yes gene_type:complete